MRVRCDRLLARIGDRRGAPLDVLPGGSICVGHEYLVLAVSVEARPAHGVMPVNLLILDEHDQHQWVPAAMFSVSSPELPSTWRAQIGHPYTDLELAPEAWLQKEFWGGYYSERREVAIETRAIFQREVELIEAEDCERG